MEENGKKQDDVVASALSSCVERLERAIDMQGRIDRLEREVARLRKYEDKYNKLVEKELDMDIMNNRCWMMRSEHLPYEIWKSGDCTWKVLKKYQSEEWEAVNPTQARWFCKVVTPESLRGEFKVVCPEDVKKSAKLVWLPEERLDRRTKHYKDKVLGGVPAAKEGS